MSTDPVLSPQEREERILALLDEVPRLGVAELVERFGTSEDSIRRDLRRLAAEGRIRRVHGAVLRAVTPLAPVATRAAEHPVEKRAIAAAVAARLVDGMTVALGGGSTALEIARAIPPARRLTVVTTAPAVALVLADKPGVETIVVGGVLDAATGTVTGARAVTALAELRADLAVVTACAVDAETGVHASRHEEAAVLRSMIAGAASALVAATSDKIGTVAAHFVAPLDRFDALVTDAGLAPDLRSALEARIAVTALS